MEELASRARRRRRSAPTTPCGLPPGDLLGYYEATRRGLACYVAAAVPTTPDRQASLVVGSGETDASGYYNAPLRPGHTYDVWFGSLISVDGVRGRGVKGGEGWGRGVGKWILQRTAEARPHLRRLVWITHLRRWGTGEGRGVKGGEGWGRGVGQWVLQRTAEARPHLRRLVWIAHLR